MKLKPNIQQSLRIHITGGSLGGDFVHPATTFWAASEIKNWRRHFPNVFL